MVSFLDGRPFSILPIVKMETPAFLASSDLLMRRLSRNCFNWLVFKAISSLTLVEWLPKLMHNFTYFIIYVNKLKLTIIFCYNYTILRLWKAHIHKCCGVGRAIASGEEIEGFDSSAGEKGTYRDSNSFLVLAADKGPLR